MESCLSKTLSTKYSLGNLWLNAIGLIGRVFANGLEESYQRLKNAN